MRTPVQFFKDGFKKLGWPGVCVSAAAGMVAGLIYYNIFLR